MNCRSGFLLLIVAVFIAGFASCNKPAERESHPEYFDKVISQWEHLSQSMYQKQNFRFLDSAYAAFPHPGNYDLYRKYALKSSYYSEVAIDYNKAGLYADSMLLMLKDSPEKHVDDYVGALSTKGVNLYRENKYDEAFQYFYAGKQFAEKYSNPCSYAALSNSMGLTCYEQQKYQQAKDYFRIAFLESSKCDASDYSKSFNFRQGYLNNMTLCYEHLGQLDSAVWYYNKVLDFLSQNGGRFPEYQKFVQVDRAVVYGNLGGTYLKMGKYKEAEPLLKESIRINTEKGAETHDAQFTSIKLAELYVTTGNFKEASLTMQRERHSLDSFPFDEAEVRWKKLAWHYYDAVGDTPKAYVSYKQYIAFQDSFNADKKDLPSADINKALENLSRQYQIEALKKKDAIKTAYLVLTIALSIMAIIILYLIWRGFRSAKNNVLKLTALNTQINEQNITIQKTLHDLEEKTRFLNSVIESTSGPIFAVDNNWKYTFFNTAHKSIVKKSHGFDLNIGDNYLNIVSANSGIDREKAVGIFNRVMSGEQFHTIAEYGEPGLYRAPYDINYNPIRQDDGAVVGMVIFSQDISERVKLIKENEEKTTLLNGLLNNLPVVVYKLNSEGIFTQSLGAGLKALNLADNALVGLNAPEQYPHAATQLNKALAGELGRFTSKVEVRGKEIYFENIIFQDNEQNKGIIGFALDVTVEKLAEKELLDNHQKIEQQATKLAELNMFKDKILAIISHDIRGPLGSLIMLIPILMEEELTQNDRTKLKEDVLQQLNATNELVDSLLRWATTSFQQVIQQKESINLHDMIQQNIKLLQTHAHSKHIQLMNHIQPEVHAIANHDQINIVLRNIIANAIKFTPVNGRITIEATGNDTTVAISVADTGVGMTDEQFKKLFTHSHGTTYGTESEKGIGLGLLLCKEYVEANGGSISVTSKINKGSTFTIVLPATSPSI